MISSETYSRLDRQWGATCRLFFGREIGELTRCFKADTPQNCTGCYFIHNCENVHDSMFCFNAKNLRYAIGNAEVGKEAFEGAKKLLLAEITSSLEKTGDYKRSIYEVAPARKAR